MPALRSHDIGASAPAQAATTTTATAKRTRRRVGPEQLKALENAYDDNPYPDETTRDALAARVQMEPKAVSVWFQNKRQAERKQSLHAATTAANAGLAPPPVAIAHPGRRRRVPPPRKAKSGSPTLQKEEEEIDELADDTDGEGDGSAVKRESATPPATVATSSANSSRAGSVRPVPRLSGSATAKASASVSAKAKAALARSASVSAKAKAALARSASVSVPATTSQASKPLPRTSSLSDIQAQPKSLARAASLSELPKQQPQQQQSGPTGVVYHVYPMPPGGYYPAYGMGMGMYGYGYGMGMGYYDPAAWGSPPIPPTPTLAAAERDRGSLSRTPSLASSSSTLLSRTPSLASTLGGSSPAVDPEDSGDTPPAKKRPRQLYDLMASSSPPPEPEPRRRRTLEWACAKDGDAQDALRAARAKELKEKREREARRAQEEDDTAMAAMLLVGLRGG